MPGCGGRWGQEVLSFIYYQKCKEDDILIAEAAEGGGVKNKRLSAGEKRFEGMIVNQAYALRASGSFTVCPFGFSLARRNIQTPLSSTAPAAACSQVKDSPSSR